MFLIKSDDFALIHVYLLVATVLASLMFCKNR